MYVPTRDICVPYGNSEGITHQLDPSLFKTSKEKKLNTARRGGGYMRVTGIVADNDTLMFRAFKNYLNTSRRGGGYTRKRENVSADNNTPRPFGKYTNLS